MRRPAFANGWRSTAVTLTGLIGKRRAMRVANSLHSSVHRKRIDAAVWDASLTGLGLLNIVTDSDTDRFASVGGVTTC